MSNARKFTAVATDPIVATEAPEWIRKMNEHYARTGTVRTADAARLSAAGSARAQLASTTAINGGPWIDVGAPIRTSC